MNNFISSDKIITTKEYRRLQVFADLVNDFNKKMQDYKVVMHYNKLDIDKNIMFNELYQFKEDVKDLSINLNLNDFMEID